MIVMRGDDRIDGDDAVAAGPVLDHDRLPPTLTQPIREQARADVGAAAGTERQNEFHRPGRPSLLGRSLLGRSLLGRSLLGRCWNGPARRGKGCQPGGGCEYETPA